MNFPLCFLETMTLDSEARVGSEPLVGRKEFVVWERCFGSS